MDSRKAINYYKTKIQEFEKRLLQEKRSFFQKGYGRSLINENSKNTSEELNSKDEKRKAGES